MRTPEVTDDDPRTLDQNDKMWAVLRDLAKQVQWRINGSMTHMTPEDWKDVITAGLKKNQRIADGIEGGFVMLGERTSKMSKKQVTELIEYALWFGTERNVKWSEPE